MYRKNFTVEIKLEIFKITCPGVWLCPKGKIRLKLKLFSSNWYSRDIQPMFPLIVNQHVTKTFQTTSNLPVRKILSKEKIRMELIQTVSGEETKLAVFSAALSEFLCPDLSNSQPTMEILMNPCKVFPGIISPKLLVKVHTKVRESRLDARSARTSTTYENESEIGSIVSVRDEPLVRQRPVCHVRRNNSKERDDVNIKRARDEKSEESQRRNVNRENCGDFCPCESWKHDKDKTPEIELLPDHDENQCRLCIKYNVLFR